MSDEIKQSQTGLLVDCTIEVFNKYLVEITNMSHLLNVKKFLEMEFGRVTYTKESVIAYIAKHKDDDNYEDKKTAKLLRDLYATLYKIEERATVVEKLIEKRNEGMKPSTLTIPDN